MRPAPTSAIAGCSETMIAQVLAVAALVLRWFVGLVRVREHIPLQESARVADPGERSEDALDVDVPVAERAERLPAPNLLHGRGLGNDLL